MCGSAHHAPAHRIGAGFASSQAMVNKTQQGGKPTVPQDTHDKNIGQREKEGEKESAKQEGAKPTVDKPADSQKTEEENEDERGTNYGQREGSTIAEDNDVE